METATPYGLGDGPESETTSRHQAYGNMASTRKRHLVAFADVRNTVTPSGVWKPACLAGLPLGVQGGPNSVMPSGVWKLDQLDAGLDPDGPKQRHAMGRLERIGPRDRVGCDRRDWAKNPGLQGEGEGKYRVPAFLLTPEATMLG